MGLRLALRAPPRAATPEPSAASATSPSQELGTVADRIEIGSPTNAVTVGFGAVWVISSDKNPVHKIDPATDEVVASIPVGRYPWDLTVGGASLFGDSSGSRG